MWHELNLYGENFVFLVGHEKGKPFEKMGRKASGLKQLTFEVKLTGSGVTEGKIKEKSLRFNDIFLRLTCDNLEPAKPYR